MKSIVLPALVSIALAAFAACSSDPSVTCRVGSECASGACDADGQCVPAPPAPDGSTGDTGAPPSPDGGADAPTTFDTGTPDSPLPGCSASDAGTITAAQVPLGPGLHAKFLIAENVTISTAGTTQPDGTRIWDFSGALSGDHDVLVETLSPMGAWYASQFANATYATQLSDTSDLLGVFQVTSSALNLLGVVSPSNGNPETELSYSPVVPSLAFPLSMGASWSTNATVTGTASSIPSTYLQSYQSSVDATGTMKTPFGTFNVLRVHTVVTSNTAGVLSVVRSDSWVTDCFGPVAAATSQTDETNDEFTNAAEVRRLTP